MYIPSGGEANLELIQGLKGYMGFGNLPMCIAIYYAAINVYSYALTGCDKYKARRRRYRISEKMFFVVSLMGGALGVVMGMTTFRHKTQHKSFYMGIPSIFLVNVICVLLVLRLV